MRVVWRSWEESFGRERVRRRAVRGGRIEKSEVERSGVDRERTDQQRVERESIEMEKASSDLALQGKPRTYIMERRNYMKVRTRQEPYGGVNWKNHHRRRFVISSLKRAFVILNVYCKGLQRLKLSFPFPFSFAVAHFHKRKMAHEAKGHAATFREERELSFIAVKWRTRE